MTALHRSPGHGSGANGTITDAGEFDPIAITRHCPTVWSGDHAVFKRRVQCQIDVHERGFERLGEGARAEQCNNQRNQY